MEIIKATAADLKECEKYFQTQPEILQYLTSTQCLGTFVQGEDDWNSVSFCTEDRTSMIKYSISRDTENTIVLSLYARTPFLAGKLLSTTWPQIKKAYNPKALGAIVHSSNIKSLKLTKKHLGQPYGVEPDGMWNIVEGRWEDAVLFKKVFR